MSQKKDERKLRIQEFFVLVWFVLVILSFLLIDELPFFVDQQITVKLLGASNIAAFLLYAFDKVQAITKRKRVPEFVLYLSAFLGGPIGALLAMHFFRHKTRKLSFQLVLAILILIELALGYWLYLK